MKKLSESIWSDLQDRSSGETIRKEDDVNLLDFDGLYDYVNKKYKDDVYKIKKGKLMGGDGQYCELFPIDENMWISIIYRASGVIRNILIMWNDTIGKSFINKLGERFKTQDFFLSQYVEIQEKDGTVSNQTYIDLIDFVLSCSVKDVFVTESIWSDLQDRSSGETIRKEDDVDLMDIDSFCDYLKNRYECDMTKSYPGFSTYKTDKGGFINIPLFIIPGKKYTDSASFTYYPDEKCIGFGCSYTYYKMMFLNLLIEKYKFNKNIIINKPNQYISGDITNSLVIEITDFILDTIKKPLIATIRRK